MLGVRHQYLSLISNLHFAMTWLPNDTLGKYQEWKVLTYSVKKILSFLVLLFVEWKQIFFIRWNAKCFQIELFSLKTTQCPTKEFGFQMIKHWKRAKYCWIEERMKRSGEIISFEIHLQIISIPLFEHRKKIKMNWWKNSSNWKRSSTISKT